MAASAISELLHYHIGPSTTFLRWSTSACFYHWPIFFVLLGTITFIYYLWFMMIYDLNFMRIRFIVLKIWRFDFFWQTGLKCLFTPNFFGGVWTHKRDGSLSNPLKGTSLAESALTWRFLCRSVHWCDLGASGRNQKKEKRKARKETYSGKLGVRPDHPRTLMPGDIREIVLSFKFRQNWLNLFRDVGCQILPFPITLASALHNVINN